MGAWRGSVTAISTWNWSVVTVHKSPRSPLLLRPTQCSPTHCYLSDTLWSSTSILSLASFLTHPSFSLETFLGHVVLCIGNYGVWSQVAQTEGSLRNLPGSLFPHWLNCSQAAGLHLWGPGSQVKDARVGPFMLTHTRIRTVEAAAFP